MEPRLMRRFGTLVVALALSAGCALSLEGCASLPFKLPSASSDSGGKPAKPAAKKPPAAKPSVADAGNAEKPPEAAPVAPPTRAPAPVAEAPATIGPATLVGRDEAATRDLLGTPSSQETRPPARVWTYDSEFCRLQLSFYMDVSSQTFRVLTFDVTPKGMQPRRGAACVAAIKDRRT